jgi:hypothetical protein
MGPGVIVEIVGALHKYGEEMNDLVQTVSDLNRKIDSLDITEFKELLLRLRVQQNAMQVILSTLESLEQELPKK